MTEDLPEKSVHNKTLRYSMSDGEESSEEEGEPGAGMEERRSITPRPLDTVKFIDDFTTVEKVAVDDGYYVFSCNKPEVHMRAKGSERMFENVVNNAAAVGLSVNTKKTQLLCIAPNMSCDPSLFVNTGSGKKMSQSKLKVLGFYFGESPNVNIKRRFRERAWSIRHLKRSGVPRQDLITLYKSLVRPIPKYASSVYHTMLTKDQANEIEKLQRGTLKTIFGQETPYEEALELGQIESLHERRCNAFDKFVKELSENERFAHWLPKQEFSGYDLRKELIYVEKRARTSRLYNSPLYAARRRLNEL